MQVSNQGPKHAQKAMIPPIEWHVSCGNLSVEMGALLHLLALLLAAPQ